MHVLFLFIPNEASVAEQIRQWARSQSGVRRIELVSGQSLHNHRRPLPICDGGVAALSSKRVIIRGASLSDVIKELRASEIVTIVVALS